MIHKVEENMAFFSHQLYPSSGLVAIQTPPQQGSECVFTEKPGRRRRNKKARNGGVLKKRKLSDEQANLLEECFGNEQKLESERKDRLASELGLEPKQVAVWFQNRRARWKNKKLEEEYARLKSVHENVVVQKCQLEFEVLRLKDRLCEAERDRQRLLEETERGGSSKSNSSSSSPSSAVDVAAALGGFDSESGYDQLFYVPDNSYDHLMDWFNLYM